jgi:hypothetical protein
MVGGCTDATGEKYLDGCETAERATVVRRIPPIRSFFDATGNGCSFACYEHLWRNAVDFIELRFERKRYDELVAEDRRYTAIFATPSEDGLFKVTRSKGDACAVAGLPVPSEVRQCILFEKISAVQSGYDYRARSLHERFRNGHADITRYELSERNTGELLASKEAYSVYWLEFFFIPVQKSCGGWLLQLSEVTQP